MNPSPHHSRKLKKFFTLVELKRDYLTSSVPTFIMLAATQGYSAGEHAHALLHLNDSLPKNHHHKQLILDELLKLPAMDVIGSLCRKKPSYDHEDRFALKFIDLKLQQLPKAERAKQRAIWELAFIVDRKYPSVKTVENFCDTAHKAAQAGFYMPLVAVVCNITHCGQELATQSAKQLHQLLAGMPTAKARIETLDQALAELPKTPLSFGPICAVTKKLARQMPKPRDKAELILRVASHIYKADPRAEDALIKLFMESTAKNPAQGFAALNDAQQEMGSHFARLFFLTAAIKAPTFPAAQANDVVDYLTHDQINLTKPQKRRIHHIASDNLRTQPQTSGPAAHFRKMLMVRALEADLDSIAVSVDSMNVVFNEISDGLEKTKLAHDCVYFALNSKREHPSHWLPYADHIVAHHQDVTDDYARFHMLGDTYALYDRAQHEENLPHIVKALIEAHNKLEDEDRSMVWDEPWDELAKKIGDGAAHNIMNAASQRLKPASALKP